MARVGSGTWANQQYGSACKPKQRFANANMQGRSVMVLREAVPAFEALAAIMAKYGYRIRSIGSYNCRKTASGGLSPHATGTAVDINERANPATGGPYGGPNKLITDMPAQMVNAILGIRTVSGAPVFGWGGHYRSYKDAMHYEIIAPAAHLATGLDPRTTQGVPVQPGRPGPPPPAYPGAPATGPAPGKPSTQGQGVEQRTPAAPETAPPPSVALTIDQTAHIPDLTPLVPAGAVDLTALSATLDLSVTEPATLRVAYADPAGQARLWPVWKSAVSVNIDTAKFTLQRLDAAGHTITAEYVDHTAWLLTQHTWTAENRITQTGGQGTRGQFLATIARRVLGDKATIDIQPGNLAQVDLAAEPGTTAWETLRAVADDVNWRVFTVAGRLVIGADEWILRRTQPIKVTANTPGIDRVEWSLVFGLPASEASMVADLTRWSAPPSQAITLDGQGPADGLWLIEQVSHEVGTPRATIRLARSEPALSEPIPTQSQPVDGGTGGAPGPSWQVTTPPPRPLPAPGGGPSAKPGGTGPDKWRYPVKGPKKVTSPFGIRVHPITGKKKPHTGVDLRAPMGISILAARPGTVVAAGRNGGYGNCIDIRHNGGDITRYAHLSKIDVRVGAAVSGGQHIGRSGSTGASTAPHLHFEYRPKGRGPVDPWPHIKNAP